jgi:hypothetical protein
MADTMVELESPATGDFTVRGMETPTAGITRDIYGMPAFVTFVVADLARTVDWYTNGLDFIGPAPRQDADFNAMMVREARRQGLGG